mmetsp:Transcript_7902/g.9050  ORF Transcript_7902/g.9050 Transcript_7902/m.9050 type:complete len:346 (+) Transcript_7902:35-1072(+)
MSSVEELTAAVATAKAAYKANKANKALKVAHKEAKAALAAAVAAAEAKAAKKKSKKSKKRKAEATVDTPTKKAKVDVAGLAAAATAAKKAYKANKADASLKAAYKSAKAAHAAAVAAEAAAPAAEEPAAEAVEEEAAPSGLAGLTNNKNKPASNPTATSKIFCGNLSWDIDDDAAKAFFKDCGETTDIFWLTDRESGKFKGCGFITFETPEAAAMAVAKNGEDLMGRPIKVDFATPKPGGGGAKKKWEDKPMSEKPEGCNTCFVGNLSYDIDDDAMYKFAETGDCGPIAKIRWLTDKESGDFKGCGFVEFEAEESVDKFALLNGKILLGRNVRIDFAKPRAPKTW